MFAYCNNNPINYADHSGNLRVGFEYYIVDRPDAALTAGTGSGYNIYPSADSAATAFARTHYRYTLSNGKECGAVIFSNGYRANEYAIGSIQYGSAANIEPDFHAENDAVFWSNGWVAVAYVHTHPDRTDFSETDREFHWDHTRIPTGNYNTSYTSYVVAAVTASSYFVHSMCAYPNGDLYFPYFSFVYSTIGGSRKNTYICKS